MFRVGPFKVWNANDRCVLRTLLFELVLNLLIRAWQSDWDLRVECFNETLDCCDKVRDKPLKGKTHECCRLELCPQRYWLTLTQGLWTPTASTQVSHPSTFLVWLGYVGNNGRTVYRSSSETYYLYYHDWGSNLGSNWVISTDYNRTEVLFCSTKLLYNLEVSDLSVLTQYGTSRQFLCGWCSSEDILQTLPC